MDISKLKLVWKYFTGGMGSVTEYLLDVLNNAVNALEPDNKKKVQAFLNTTEKILATLCALKWLCPTKWQAAYTQTILSVSNIIESLSDLKITSEDIGIISKSAKDAIAAWKSDDDETCVDMSNCE